MQIFETLAFQLEASSHNFKINSIPGDYRSVLNNVRFRKKIEICKEKSNWKQSKLLFGV